MNNKLNSIMRELQNGFYLEEQANIASSIAMTVLEEEDYYNKVKPNKEGDCSLCRRNSCESCKYYL